MTEAEFQAAVLELCAWLHLLVFHAQDSRRSAPGFPDLVIAGPRGVIFAELKSPRGRLRPAQQEWRYMLLASGQCHVVWRPDNLSVITDVLKGIA